MLARLVAAGDLLMFWRREPRSRAILSGIFTVGALTLGVKAIAFGKELIVAQTFGTGDLMDALVIAFLLPSFLATVVGGEIAHALLPFYNKMRIGGEREKADRLAVNTVWMAVGVLGLLALVLVPLSPVLMPVLAANFGAEKLELTRQLFVAMLPFILFNGLSYVFVLLLQAHKKFGLAALSPALVPLVTVTCLLLGYERWGTDSLVFGLSAGALLQLVIIYRGFRGLCKRSVWAVSRPGGMELSVLKNTGPLVAGSVVMYGAVLVDSTMAAWLDPGSVAVLGYADRLCGVVLMLVATAVGEVLLPFLSERVAAGDFKGLRAMLFKFSGLIAGAMVPLSVMLWIAAPMLVSMAFERGEFTAEDTARVAGVLRFYSLEIPFYVAAVLASRVVVSLGATGFLFLNAVVNLTVNVGLNLLLLDRMGVEGIALSTVFVHLISGVMLFAYVLKVTSPGRGRSQPGNEGGGA